MKKLSIPKEYYKDAKKALIAAGGAGPLGTLGAADTLAIAGIWGTCLYTIAKRSGCSLDTECAVKIARSAITGGIGYMAGCRAASALFSLIPCGGVAAAIGISSAANVIFTYRYILTLGIIFREHENEKMTPDSLEEYIKSMFVVASNGLRGDVQQIAEILTC